MVKTGVFKKIIALTAAVVMVFAFAASASAVRVDTTTQYAGEGQVNVIATVSEVTPDVQVTYYATKGEDVVFVDQKPADEYGVAEFDYVTAEANLEGVAKVGYTDASAAEDGDIPVYTISGTGITTVKVPTENINGTHTLTYAVTDGFKVTGVDSEDAEVTYVSYEGTDLKVTIAEAEGNVALTVEEEEIIDLPDPEANFIAAAGIISKGDDYSKAGDRKITVIATLKNVGDDYGVIISDEAIVTGDAFDARPADAYPAQAKGEDNGAFAVQLIDDGANIEGAIIKSGATYYTAVYYFNPKTEKYVVIAGNDFVVE